MPRTGDEFIDTLRHIKEQATRASTRSGEQRIIGRARVDRDEINVIDTIVGVVQKGDDGSGLRPQYLYAADGLHRTNQIAAIDAKIEDPDDFELVWGFGSWCDTPTNLSAPGTPLNLAAVPATNGIIASWDAPTNDGNTVITGYRIEWSRVGQAWAGGGSHTTSARMYEITGLTIGVTYRIRVRAMNLIGNGNYTAQITQEPRPADTEPSAVRSLMATVVNLHENIRVTWSLPETDGGAAISSYDVQYKTSAQQWAAATTVSVTSRAYTIENVSGATTYNIRVRAVNSVGGGTWVTAVATTKEDVLPAVSSLSVNRFVITITYNEAMDQNAVPSAGAFEAVVRGTPSVITNVAVSGEFVRITISTEVESTDEVHISYTAPNNNALRDVVGNLAPDFASTVVTNNTPADTTPSAPRTLRMGVTGGHVSVTITWVVPSSNGGDAINDYTLQIKESTDIWDNAVEATISTASLRYIYSGTTGSKTYNVRVAANNDVGRGAWLSGNFTTEEDVPPVVSTLEATLDSLEIVYNENLDTGSVPSVNAFDLQVNGSSAAITTVAISGSTVTLTLPANLESTDTVTLAYTKPATNPIQDTIGNDAATYAATAVTNNTDPDTAPTAPTSLTVTVNNGHESLAIAWEEPTSDGGDTITNYVINVKTSTQMWADADTINVSGTTFTYTYTSVGSTTYNVRVLARNTVGDSPYATADATTEESDPPNISTVVVHGTAVTLTYDESLDENSVPATSSFTVMIGTVAAGITLVAIDDTVVTLTLDTAAVGSDTVTVSYAVPTTNPIQDLIGNDAAAISAQEATNTSPGILGDGTRDKSSHSS